MWTPTQIFVRTIVTIVMPLILLYAFFAELLRGFRSAFVYAWLEVRCEWASYKFQMRRDDY
jgi:hypothetical protein